MIQINQIRKWNTPSYLNVYRHFIVIAKMTTGVDDGNSDVYKIRYLDNNDVETRYARSIDLYSKVSEDE